MNTYTQTQINTNTNRNAQRPIAIIVILLIAVAAIWMVVSRNVASDPLTNATTTWESQSVDNYSYELQVSCFCFPDMTRAVNIVVAGGVVESVTYIDDGTAADPDLFASYSTVEKLFERLEGAQSQNPASFDVTFDAQYGVPQSVSIDIDERMADEEINFTVSNFEAMP